MIVMVIIIIIIIMLLCSSRFVVLCSVDQLLAMLAPYIVTPQRH